jgi:hypothetical protein
LTVKEKLNKILELLEELEKETKYPLEGKIIEMLYIMNDIKISYSKLFEGEKNDTRI